MLADPRRLGQPAQKQPPALHRALRAVAEREEKFSGAKDGTRTHGHLGHNQVLYQLSYFRHGKVLIRSFFSFGKFFSALRTLDFV